MEDFTPSIANLSIAISFANQIIIDPLTPPDEKALYQKYLTIFLFAQKLNMDNLVSNCQTK